jgi:hypothetical protein
MAAASAAKPAVQGAVQRAMGMEPTIVDTIWKDFMAIKGVSEEFGPLLAQLESRPFEEKIVAVQTLVPLMKFRINEDPEALAKKRAGVLAGYRAAAAKNGIPWADDLETFRARGMDTWESEREALEDKELAVPDYYAYGGQGPLHSYASGNCCWEAAFDVKSAFELVHMHHFPQLT